MGKHLGLKEQRRRIESLSPKEHLAGAISTLMLLRLWYPDQQHQHDPETC